MMNYASYCMLIILFFAITCTFLSDIHPAQEKDRLTMVPILLAQGNMPAEMRRAKIWGRQLSREFGRMAHDLDLAIQHLEQWNIGYSLFFFGKIKYFQCESYQKGNEQDVKLEAIFSNLGTWKTWKDVIKGKFAKAEQKLLVELIGILKSRFDITIGDFASNNQTRAAIKRELEQNYELEAETLSDGYAFVHVVNEFVKSVNRALDQRICTIL